MAIVATEQMDKEMLKKENTQFSYLSQSDIIRSRRIYTKTSHISLYTQLHIYRYEWIGRFCDNLRA